MAPFPTTSTYTLTGKSSAVIRDADGVTIHESASNPHWLNYQDWLAAGNTPNPYVPPTLTKAQEADAWLNGGLTITSNAKSVLNGTYGVMPPDNHNINAIATAYNMTDRFPNNQPHVTIFDINGAPHDWDVQFSDFVVAVRDFVHNCRLYAHGAIAALPPNSVQIASPAPPAVEPMPAFAVYNNATQAVAKNTPTKIMFDTVEFDTTNAFDRTLSRFHPKIAGYYEVNCGCGINAGSVKTYTSIYKNGAEYRRSTTTDGANARLSTLVHFNGTTDYVEGWVVCTSNFSTVSGGAFTSFSGALTQKDVIAGTTMADPVQAKPAPKVKRR